MKDKTDLMSKVITFCKRTKVCVHRIFFLNMYDLLESTLKEPTRLVITFGQLRLDVCAIESKLNFILEAVEDSRIYFKEGR